MLFNTIEFWAFFLPVLVFTHLLPRRGQNILLLVASYVFYGAWDWRFLSLIFLSTVVDYVVAPMTRPGNPEFRRKSAVLCSVVFNLGVLGFFKYCNFFVDTFAYLFGIDTGFSLYIVLPVGISFYTFQTMSYTLDVYRGKLEPVQSFLDFALYVAFFPQLVAGPIERGSRLIPQITHPREIIPERLESGVHLIAWGLFKKVIVADTLAHLVNSVYGSASPSGPEVYLATIAFAFQIYGDFSGYSDIARGTARLLGFELMLNFNLPYIAHNPADFWRRWHISLSTWLRDYLYIPLGGSRHGRLRTYRNLMITMVLGGLWHGARWNFVFWGVFHGAILALHRLFTEKENAGAFGRIRIHPIIKVMVMFHLTLIGWLLFRVENMQQLNLMVKGLLQLPNSVWTNVPAILQYMALPILLMLPYEILQWKMNDLECINRLRWPWRAIFFGLCIGMVIFLNRSTNVPFIYFQI
jgi:D-alanyl-lipoteichoic acid acyltransferase DltB (MBOAT superfamily)